MADRSESSQNVSRPQRSSSDNTLNSHQEESNEKTKQGNKDEENDREQNGQEEKGEEAPPAPVGFFDKRLHSTRIEVAWKWAVTSEQTSMNSVQR